MTAKEFINHIRKMPDEYIAKLQYVKIGEETEEGIHEHRLKSITENLWGDLVLTFENYKPKEVKND